MKTRRLQWGLALSLLSSQLAVSAPQYISNFTDFSAYPYNTAAYKQGGAFVGCGPTTGAMMFAYFQELHSLSGLLVDPGVAVDTDLGLNTAWALHSSQYMKTGADGFGKVDYIESGLETYASDRNFTVRVTIHAGTSYSDPNSPDAAWLNAYGPFGDAWTNDGAFWIKNANGTWKIDPDLFCDFLAARLSLGVPIFLTIDTNADGGGDHWVPLVGYDRTSKQYAFYNTYDTNLHWADIYYMGDPAGKKVNSISMVRTVEFIPSGEPDIAVDASFLNFGTVEIGDNSIQYLTVSNTGAADLVVTETDHSGSNAADFSILNGGPFTLVPGNARQIGIRFTPSGSGSRSATMVFDSNDPDENPLEIGLSGTGGDADPLQWVKAESPGCGTVNAFAVMGENVFAGTEWGGVFLSTDKGATWNPVNSGLTNLCIRSVSARGTRLYAGTWGDGVYCSTDSGSHWNPTGAGMTNLYVTSLEAGTEFGNAPSGLLAGTWGGVFYSSDSGTTWTGVNNGITETHVRSVMVASGIFFAGTIDGLFRSLNNGQSWTPANTGLTNTAIISLARRGVNLYAGTDGGGVFHPASAGDIWEPYGPGIENAVVPSLARGNADLYAATWGGGVFVRPHNLWGWNGFSPGLTELNIRSVAVRRGKTAGSGILLAGTENGDIWRRPLDEGFGVAVDGERDDFYSGLSGPDEGALALRSYAWNDNGKPDSDDDLSARIWTAWDDTWFYLYEEVTDDVVSGNAMNVWEEDCLELKFDPQPTDSMANSVWETRLTALGGGGPGVVAFDDLNSVPEEEKAWVRLTVPGGYILELAILWKEIKSGSETITPQEGVEFGMAINQHDNDGGAKRIASVQWAAVLKDAVWNTPKFMGTVRLLPDHKMQFVPTNKMTGVTNPVPYDGSDYSRTGVRETGDRPASLALGQNYPNPFNPETVIAYSLPNPGEVRLSVIDILGREVSVPVHGFQQAGGYHVSFNAGNLASGMYFYRLEAGTTVLIRKMIISR